MKFYFKILNIFFKKLLQNENSCGTISKQFKNGPLVKRLRRSPLKAESWVRFPYGSPAKQKGHSQECPFCFADNPYGLRTHFQNIFVLDWGRIVCPVVPCRNLARQGIFPYKFSLAPCLTKICLFALA